MYIIEDTETTSISNDERMKKKLQCVHTRDHSSAIKEKEMRLISDLESIFLLDSIDGKRRYKGATITLRQTGVD